MKAYIITGPESSGSVFISKIIAYVLKQTKNINDWNGYGYCNNKGPISMNDIIIYHISQPSAAAKEYKWFTDLHRLKKMFKNYNLHFILCTRYHNISNISKAKKYKKPCKKLKKDLDRSRNILSEIILKEKYFIWNYETMLYLKNIYFQTLYKFLDTKSTFFPNNLIDGNKPYIKEEYAEYLI